MLLPLILGAAVIYLAVLRPHAPLSNFSPLASSNPGPLPPTVDQHMSHGMVYGFSAASNLSADQFTQALFHVGADIEPPLVPGVGFAGFSGTFVWNGDDGEPTENLPGVTWLALHALPVPATTSPVLPSGVQPQPITAPGPAATPLTTVSGPSSDFLSRRAHFHQSIGE